MPRHLCPSRKKEKNSRKAASEKLQVLFFIFSAHLTSSTRLCVALVFFFFFALIVTLVVLLQSYNHCFFLLAICFTSSLTSNYAVSLYFQYAPKITSHMHTNLTKVAHLHKTNDSFIFPPSKFLLALWYSSLIFMNISFMYFWILLSFYMFENMHFIKGFLFYVKETFSFVLN